MTSETKPLTDEEIAQLGRDAESAVWGEQACNHEDLERLVRDLRAARSLLRRVEDGEDVDAGALPDSISAFLGGPSGEEA